MFGNCSIFLDLIHKLHIDGIVTKIALQYLWLTKAYPEFRRTVFTGRKRSCGKVMFSQASWDRSHGRVEPPPPTADYGA